MFHFTPSEKQWVASFLLVDVSFWFIIFVTCVFSPDDCLANLTFGPAGFYAPFWFILQWVNLSSTSFALNLALIAVLGLFCHALVGWAIGFILRRYLIKLYVSIPVSVVCVMIIIIAGLTVGRATGVLF